MAVDYSGAEHQCDSVTEGFRNNVALLLERRDGKIFLGERVDRHEAWQFPQGGVDAGESLETALHREVKEEIGLATFSRQGTAKEKTIRGKNRPIFAACSQAMRGISTSMRANRSSVATNGLHRQISI